MLQYLNLPQRPQTEHRMIEGRYPLDCNLSSRCYMGSTANYSVRAFTCHWSKSIHDGHAYAMTVMRKSMVRRCRQTDRRVTRQMRHFLTDYIQNLICLADTKVVHDGSSGQACVVCLDCRHPLSATENLINLGIRYRRTLFRGCLH